MTDVPTQLYPHDQRPAAARLVVMSGAASIPELRLLTESVTIGRDPGSTLVLTDPLVSRRHALIEFSDGGWLLIDMGTPNGTYVNGARISRHHLVPGDRVVVGNTALLFQQGAPGISQPVRSYPPAQPPAPYIPSAQTGAMRANPGPYQPAPPPQPQPPPYYSQPGQSYPAVPPRRKSSCGCWISGCFVSLLLLAAAVGGAYFAYTQGYINRYTLANLLGNGPGQMEIDNLSDATVYVSIMPLENSESNYERTRTASSMDVLMVVLDPPGRYRVNFGSSSGGSELGTCSLEISQRNQVQFVILPQQVLVTSSAMPEPAGPDLVVNTSALCR